MVLHETQGMKAPVLFISHGAPTFAIEPGALGPELERLGKRMAGIQAVLVISPHWQTRNVKVMTTPQPETIHDFGGFAPSSIGCDMRLQDSPRSLSVPHCWCSAQGWK